MKFRLPHLLILLEITNLAPRNKTCWQTYGQGTYTAVLDSGISAGQSLTSVVRTRRYSMVGAAQ